MKKKYIILTSLLVSLGFIFITHAAIYNPITNGISAITVTTSTLTYSSQVFATTTITVINNTTTATNVVSTTIPANILGTSGQSMRVVVYGTYLNNTGASQAITTGFSYGGSSFLGTGSTAVPTNASVIPFQESFWLSNASGTNNNQLGSYAIVANSISNQKQFSAGTVNSAIAQPLNISLTLATSSASLQITVNSVNIMLDGATTTIVTGTTSN